MEHGLTITLNQDNLQWAQDPVTHYEVVLMPTQTSYMQQDILNTARRVDIRKKKHEVLPEGTRIHGRLDSSASRTQRFSWRV